MRRVIRWMVSGCAAALVCAAMQSCVAAAVAVPLAAAATAGEKGAAFWQRGELDYVDEARLEEMSLAVDMTITELGLETEDQRDRIGRLGFVQTRIWDVDHYDGRLFTVTVRYVTDVMTRVEIKVDGGAFGDQSSAQLFVSALHQNLGIVLGESRDGAPID